MSDSNAEDLTMEQKQHAEFPVKILPPLREETGIKSPGYVK